MELLAKHQTLNSIRRATRWPLAFVVAALGLGCPQRSTLTSLAVTPAEASVVAGATQQFTATGTYSDGATRDLTESVTWTTSAPTVASVVSSGDGRGLVTTLLEGVTTVTATMPDTSLSAGATLTVLPRPARRLVFRTQPGGGVAGVAWAQQPVIAVVDDAGAVMAGDTSTIKLSLVAAGGAELSGVASVAAVDGVATFTGLSASRAFTGYTLVASASGAERVSSAPFDVTPGPASRLGLIQGPGGGAAGAPWRQQPLVAVQDAFGNTVGAASAQVTLALGANPGGGTLSGPATVATVDGVATFSGLSLDKAATGYTLTASATGLASTTSVPFDVFAAAPSRLLFGTQPSGGPAGAPFATQPVVRFEDAFGNAVVASSAPVTLALGANASGGALAGTATVTAVNGVATFSGLSIDKAATGYTLVASSGTLTAATSMPFAVTAGPAAQLVFTTQPGNGTAGLALARQPVVAVHDAFGNPTTSTASVALALSANPGGGALSGPATTTAIGGVATFAGLSIDKAATGYALTASAPGLASATSASFAVTAGAASQLAFATQPGGGAVGTAWNQQPAVAVQDAFGNLVTTATPSVTLSLAANPGSGTLSGPTVAGAVSGMASFSGLSIDRVGQGYTLRASAAGLVAAVSAPFEVTGGNPARLVFLTQPGGGTAGVPWAQQPVVVVQDAFGNTATSSSARVTLTLSSSPPGGALSGTASVTAVNGVATFSGLSVDRAGTGYTLTASFTGLTSATSAPFSVATGAAARLVFTTQPGNGTAGAPLPQQPVVAVEDGFGNRITTSTAAVTLALATHPSGATLGGGATAAAAAGLATFSGLFTNRAATGLSLVASAPGLASATSTLFDVAAGTATRLAFTTQPSGGAAGAAWAQQPLVVVQDALGNTVPTTVTVTLALANNPGGATLSGTAADAAVNGVATFAGLSVDKAGSGYTLRATSTGLANATSTAFDVAPAAPNRLVFTTQPGGATAGAALSPQPVVTVQDAFGNTVTASTASITLALDANPGGGALSGQATVAAANGVATFSGLSLNRAGAGYTLRASLAGVTGATSAAFTIGVGAAARLVFVSQPGGGVVGVAWAQQPAVAFQDAFGNTVPTATGTVTLALAASPGTATLAGPLTATAVNGVATFSGLSLNRSGAGYTLSAASGSFPVTTSAWFSVSTAAPNRLVFATQPGGGPAGLAWTQQPVVTIQDALGNVVSSSANVTLSLASNPGNDTLVGTTTVAAVNGVATFSGLFLNAIANGYTLAATGGPTGVTAATSAAFDISTGAQVPASLGFQQQPVTATAGVVFPVALQVAVLDTLGNVVTSYSGLVTVTSAANLFGTTTVNALNGVATFTNVGATRAGSFALQASTTHCPGGPTTCATRTGTSSLVTVNPGGANRLAIVQTPTGGQSNGVFCRQPVVEVQDSQGNLVVTDSRQVTVSLGANPVGGTLSGPLTASAVAGRATFSGLSLNAAGQGYALTFSAPGLAAVTSGRFDVYSTLPPNTFVRPGTAKQNALAIDSMNAVVTAGETTEGALSGVLDLYVTKYALLPTVTWERRAGAPNASTTNLAVTVDSAGSVYALGATDGLIGASRTCYDYVLSRYTALGARNLLVQGGPASCGNTPVAVAVDAAGNIYVYGASDGPVDGVASPNPSSNYYLTKYSGTGLRLWTVVDGVANGFAANSVRPVAMALDASGNVYVTGEVRGGPNAAPAFTNFDGLTRVGTRDVYLTKYDPMGERRWTRLEGIATRDLSSTGLAVDSSGNAYVTGLTSFSLNGQARVSTNTADLFFVKYDPDGGRLWTRQRGATGVSPGPTGAAVVDASSSLYVAGSIQSLPGVLIGFDGNPFGSSADLFVMKLDSSGNWVWSRQRGAGGALSTVSTNALAIDGSNNLYLGGMLVNGIDGRCATSNTTPAGFVVSYSASGVIR